jgi:replicative DNA helicase
MNNFIGWKEAFTDEAEVRALTNIEGLCKYGIKPLDDALRCIRKSELVVIGADSGSGKTEVALNIARHNSELGKKVAVYNLEGGHIEAIQRMKWTDMCQIYFKKHHDMGIEMDYQKWIINDHQDKFLMNLEGQVYNLYTEKYKENLYFYNVEGGLTITDFVASLLSFHNLYTAFGKTFNEHEKYQGFDLDLIVLDHLQYFSLAEGENEISEITKIIRAVKDITDKYHIPVVLISHFRKKSKDRGLPDQEDFYGSSNLPKISTTSIIIAPANGKENFYDNIYPTWFRVVKSRMGIRSSYGLLCDFNNTMKKYCDRYEVYSIDGEGHVFEEPLTENKLPKFARGQHG